MNHDFTMFIVEDADSVRILLESAFRNECRVESFATAEDCLARLNEEGCLPDIFLLDVDLPGMDGYTLCRQIKEQPGMDNIPVIFVSSLDDLDSRLEGYGAGGMDYVVKPYNLAELKQKVGAARRLSVERQSLNERMLEAQSLSSLILSNLDEYAVLINFLRSLNDCDTPRALLDSLFGLLRAYRLQCAIQLRWPGHEMTISENGENRPLEVAVINHVRSMDRIFEFKMRAAYNFEHITILVNNVPRHDPDLCGRIRDNVAIAAECTNAKLLALQVKGENTQAKGTATTLLSALQTAVQDLERKHAQAIARGSMQVQNMLDDLAGTFAALGMTSEQETRIESLVRANVIELTENYDFSGDAQATFKNIAEQLACILTPSTMPSTLEDDQGTGSSAVAPEKAGAGVELF